MSWISRLALPLRALFRRSAVDAELEEELRFHLELEEQKNLRAGMSPAEARRAALLAFGGVERFREAARDVRGVGWLERRLADARFAFRSFCRAPGFTAAAVATLALGIGATTAVFSVVDAVLLTPLPFREPGRLVLLWGSKPGSAWSQLPLSYPNFRDVQELATAFEGVAAWSALEDSRLVLTGAGEPEQLRYGVASPTLFPVLGVRPLLGRTFTAADDQGQGGRVVLVGERLWRQRLGADPRAVGRPIVLDGAPYTVVGVLPAGFRFGGVGVSPELWIPLGQDPTGTGPRSRMYARGAAYLGVVARLRTGVTPARASADLERVATALAERYPRFDGGWQLRAVPLREQVVADRRGTLLLLLGSVALVLLIACVNVANLLLARGAARGREVAIRAALGAARRRIVAQLLTESACLSLLGGVAGVLVAWVGLRLLVRFDFSAPTVFVPWGVAAADIGLDARVLAFALVASVGTGLLFGLAPALRAARPGLAPALGHGGRSVAARRERRLGEALVVLETTLSVLLLAGAGLLLRGLARLEAADPGFHAEHVLTGEVGLPGARYRDPARVVAFFDDVLGRMRALPGVRAAGAVESLPLAGVAPSTDYVAEGAPAAQDDEVDHLVATPGYFSALGIRLVDGRFLDARDDADAPRVALVSESFARRHWPGESAVGRRVALTIEALRFVGDGPPVVDIPSAYRTIVGVVADVRQDGLTTPPHPTVYLPLAQAPARDMAIVVRAAGDPEPLAGELRRAVAAVDSGQPVSRIRPMVDLVGDATGAPRYRSELLAVFAAAALALAAVGLYGVLAYAVTRRRAEIGVRLALGATHRDILALVGGAGLRLAAAGVVLGLAGALALGRLFAGLLYGVTPADPVALGGAAIALGLVATAATLLPARRAARVDPASTLRTE